MIFQDFPYALVFISLTLICLGMHYFVSILFGSVGLMIFLFRKFRPFFKFFLPIVLLFFRLSYVYWNAYVVSGFLSIYLYFLNLFSRSPKCIFLLICIQFYCGFFSCHLKSVAEILWWFFHINYCTFQFQNFLGFFLQFWSLLAKYPYCIEIYQNLPSSVF